VVLLSRLVRARLIAGVKAVFSDLSPAVLLLVSYACVLLAAAVTGASDPIGQRLLSPIYVPVTLVLLTLGYCSVVPAHAPANAVASRVAAILLALWLCYPLAFVAQSSIHNIRDGAGDYSTRAWRGSETIAYSRRVLSNESNVRVYSNGAMALWELARVNANEMPDRKSVNLSDLAGHWPAVDGSVLVWFENPAWRRDFSIEELGRIARVEEVAHFGDGSVYRVWRRGTAVDEPDIGNIGGAASAPPAGP
jgi:hypothetical protein